MANKRMMYIDYIKAVGILLIVFAHCIQWFLAMGKVNEYVISFHVPLFFVVSGCLSYYKDNKNIPFRTFLGKRAKSLLIPYVIFSVINSAIKLSVMFLKSTLNRDTLMAEMKELLITGNGTVWFLLTLFLVETVIFFYRKTAFADNYVLAICVAIVCLVLPYLLPQGTGLQTILDRVLAGTGYYLVGWLTVGLMVRFTRKVSFFSGIGLFALGTVVAVIHPAKFSFFTGEFSSPVSSIAVSILCSLGIVFMIYSVENHISGFVEKSLSFLGQNSLCIMLIHPILLNCFTFPFGGLMASLSGGASVLGSLVLFVLIVLVDIPFVLVINRWFPWVLGRFRK